MDDRFQRHGGLFGAEGQRRLGRCKVGIAGLGGLGSHVGQQLAYLGVPDLRLVDGDTVGTTNLNRLIGATPDDVGRLKVDTAADMIRAILPESRPVRVPRPLEHAEAEQALRKVDVIIACLDDDLARLHLVEFASGARLPVFDLATDVMPGEGGPPDYGGRVLWSGRGERCAYCMGELDQNDLRRATMSDDELEAEARIYGVPVEGLKPGTGPSVVSVNGVVASLAVTEFMKFVTGLADPAPLLHYVGNAGIVRKVTDPPSIAACPYCSRWGRG
jgi:hypothetical protein